jgi:hypothetical protein
MSSSGAHVCEFTADLACSGHEILGALFLFLSRLLATEIVSGLS